MPSPTTSLSKDWKASGIAGRVIRNHNKNRNGLPFAVSVTGNSSWITCDTEVGRRHADFSVLIPSVFLRVGDDPDRTTSTSQDIQFFGSPNQWVRNRLLCRIAEP